MSGNMALWDDVQRTDPAYTKEYSGPGGFSGTSISGHYMVMRATEVFGPIGIGWGYEIVEERFDTGAAIAFDADGNETTRALTHVMRLKLWFDNGGQKGEVEHYGVTPYISSSRNGPRTDPEAPKKSLTDALKKCLSMLGFGADVYLGQFDDVNYVEATRTEFDIERAEDRDEERERKQQEYIDKMKQYAEQMAESVNVTMLKALYKEAVRKAGYRNDHRMVKRLEEIYQETEERLKPKEVKGEQ